MKYIAEKDRKFIDKLQLKVYHTLHPIDQVIAAGYSSPILSIDHKIILARSKKINQQLSHPKSVLILIMLSGKLIYSDSLGFCKKLRKDDAVIIEDIPQNYYYTIENPASSLDAEFLELSLRSFASQDKHTLLINNKTFIQHQLNNYFAPSNKGLRGKNLQFYKGIFGRASHYQYPASYSHNRIALFILKGELLANGLKMTGLDTLLTTESQELKLDFIQDTSFLLFEFNTSKDGKTVN